MIKVQSLRMPVTFVLCPLLFLQACTTASPIPPGAVLSRSVVEDAIELKADPETASHLPNAEEIAGLRDPRVIPVSVVTRNVGAQGVIVGSSAISLQGGDGRVFPMAEGVQRAIVPAVEREDSTDGPFELIKDLAAGRDPLSFAILTVVAGTMPLWGPPVLITQYVKRQSREQRLRNAAFERLEPVYLARGEAVGGVLYFAVEGDLPVTLATATLVVPVRRPGTGTGEEHPVRLPLGKAGDDL